MKLPNSRILVSVLGAGIFSIFVAEVRLCASQLSISVSAPTVPESPAMGMLKPPPEVLAAAQIKPRSVKAPVLPAFSKPSPEITFSADPTDQEITVARCFDAPLEPSTSAVITGENAAFAGALLKFHNVPANMDPIYSFLDGYPKTRWRASLLLNLALIYRHQARWTKVLPLLEESWNLSKGEISGGIRANADRAFGELTQMHARLGHYERLQALFTETKGRDVRGSGTEPVREAEEGLWKMEHEPGEAFRCGPLALARIYGYTFPKQQLPQELDEFKSTSSGTSLYDVNAWAEKLKLGYQVAYRNPGSEIIVPSVIHWKIGHFAALLPGAQSDYISRDATFRSDDSLSKEVIDSEASGYFLVPKGALPGGWRSVPDAEARSIFGKGDTGEAGPPPPPCQSNLVGGACPSCQGANDPSSDSGGAYEGWYDDSDDDDDGGGSLFDGGMTVYAFEPASISLVLRDTPVGYSPPIGQAIRFTANYNHRESSDQSNVSNLGNKWCFDWLSYIQVNSSAATVSYGPGGGQLTYSGFNPTTGYFAPQLLSQDELVKLSATSYVLYHRDGSKDIYNLSDASASPRIYRTSSVDKIGNAVIYIYDSYYRMIGVQDAINQITIISYDTAAVPGSTKFYEIMSVTDPFQRSATFNYNSVGQLTSITDVLGIISSFTYGSGDFVSALTTPYGTTTFRNVDTTLNNGGNFNGLYRSLQVTDPLGGQELIEWDEILTPPFQDVTNTPGIGGFGALPSLAPVGFVNSYLAYRNTFYWDKRALMQSGNYNNAFIFHWLHDLASNNSNSGYVLESTKAPLENRVWRSYNGQSNTIVEGTSNLPNAISRLLDDGSNQVYKYQYNQVGNVTQSIDPLGRTVNYLYAGNGIDLQQVNVKNGSGSDLNRSILYNGYHLPSSITDASGQTTQYTYNSYGEVETIIDPLNETTTFSYLNGYLQNITGPVAGAITSFTYDAAGRVETVTDSEGYTVSMTYDAADRPLTVTFPDGTYTQRSYKLLDPQWSRDRLGRWSLRVYDALRHLVATQDPLLRITYFEHCVCGALTAIVDASGKRTIFNRDLEERLTQKVFADGTAVSLSYENTISRLHSKTDQKGQTKSFAYNEDNSLRSLSYQNASFATPSVSYTYDGAYARIVSMVDGVGTTTYSYDPITATPTLGAGRLGSISGPILNSSAAFTYDQLGRVSASSINGSANSNNWKFDALGRITSVTNPLGTFAYQYVDETARMRSMAFPNGQTTNFNYYPNASTDNSGDGDQRLQSIQNLTSGGTNLSTFAYTYDSSGKIITWTKQLNSGAVSPGIFNYDAANQLSSAIVSNPATHVTQGFFYTYDQSGNRTQEQIDSSINTSAFNPTNEYSSETSGGVMSFEGTVSETAVVTVGGNAAVVDSAFNWLGNATVTVGTNLIPLTASDFNGNSISKNINVTVTGAPNRNLAYDANGNLTNNGAGQVYQWDAANRLVEIVQSSGTTGFVYDGSGRRVQETLNGTVVKQWVWCGGRACEERDTNGNVTKRFYGQGEQIAGTPYYFTRDHLGSVREMTDGNGTIRALCDYDPYGRATRISGDMNADFGFTGDYFHQATGLNLTIYRAYDANLGRWLSRDPIGEAGGLNLYGYVGNNPISFVDPFGLAPGDPYSTRDTAAWNALNDINARSISENREYAGRIYKTTDGTYSYTAPIPGTEDRSTTGTVPDGTEPVASYHTHGDYSDCNGKRTDQAHDAFNSDTFSNTDKKQDDKNWSIDRDLKQLDPSDWYVGYLGTPSGVFKKYSPGKTPDHAITIVNPP